MVDFDSINKSNAFFNWPAENPNQENMYEWAIHYLDLGWNIMPVEAAGKKPRLWKWEQYQVERVTPELAEEWWEKSWPYANIALICGKISGMVVLDIDDSSRMRLGYFIRSPSNDGNVSDCTGISLFLSISRKWDISKF